MFDFPQPLRLAVGTHKAGSGKGCAMNVISWENGDTIITDYPTCSNYRAARIIQAINDHICTHKKSKKSDLCSDCSLIVLHLGHLTVGTGRDTLDQCHADWIKACNDTNLTEYSDIFCFLSNFRKIVKNENTFHTSLIKDIEDILLQLRKNLGLDPEPTIDPELTINAVEKMMTVV